MLVPLYGLTCLIAGVCVAELAARLGVSRWLVIAGFLVGFVVQGIRSRFLQ
jgi:hypothetical protein